MTKAIRIFCVAILSAFVLGCATAPPPGPGTPGQSLAVGRLQFVLSGFGTYGAATVNGTQTSGVVLTIRDSSSNKAYEVTTSGPDGLFFFSPKTPGRFRIEKFYYKNTHGGAWADVGLHPRTELNFRVKAGQATNLGTIVDTYIAGEPDRVKLAGQQELTRMEFAKKYPDSAWNKATWWNEFGAYSK